MEKFNSCIILEFVLASKESGRLALLDYTKDNLFEKLQQMLFDTHTKEEKFLKKSRSVEDLREAVVFWKCDRGKLRPLESDEDFCAAILYWTRNDLLRFPMEIYVLEKKSP